MQNQKPRLGIFGGTFNPIHIGHLILAEDVREEFALDKIIYIPTSIPPHKKLEDDVSGTERAKMIEIAIDGNPCFLVDYAEIRRGGVSYTVDTAEYIYREYEFIEKPYFILGSDQAVSIGKWKDVEKLVKLFNFIVILRRGERDKIENLERYLKDIGLEFMFYTRREIDITSSEIRKNIKAGKSFRYLVSDGVYRYILKNNLYK